MSKRTDSQMIKRYFSEMKLRGIGYVTWNYTLTFIEVFAHFKHALITRVLIFGYVNFIIQLYKKF